MGDDKLAHAREAHAREAVLKMLQLVVFLQAGVASGACKEMLPYVH